MYEHHHHHQVKMCKCVFLFLLFVALVPGVLVTINFGLKNKMVPVLIHGAIFAVIYSCLSHAFWVYKQRAQQKMMRHLNQAIVEEIQMDQLANVQMNQMVQNEILSNLATKCDGKSA
jgi:hypothetical protein